jgi:hypothetical protein
MILPPRATLKGRLGSAAFLCAAVLSLAPLSGCNVVGFLGAMEESRRRNSTHNVDAEYTGLAGKNYAVLVIADRFIQGDNPSIVPYVTTRITNVLSDTKEGQAKIAAAGVIPADRLLSYLYEHPHWTTMPRGELAKELGVQRLIVVELLEYRLSDPGNQYLWSGLATGTVGVCEADGPAPDEFAFEKPIKVSFPDKDGYGPNEMSSQMVSTELAKRFTDRCAWLFYAHQEPYYVKY